MARASNVARLAEPLPSVSTKEAIRTLKKYTTEHKVEAIAIGLPRNLAGDDTQQTRWVRVWVDKAKSQISTPLYWQDEALTSVKAEEMKPKIKNSDIDSVSAAIILQDFLDTTETERVVC
jgi:putative transcription antitermination factor YqgF